MLSISLSTVCPQAGLPHLPFMVLAIWTTLPSAPHPLPPCSVSSVPVLLSFTHSPAFDHVSLLWPEQRAVIPTPHPHHIIAQCTPNAPGICGIVYVTKFWYSVAAFLITGMLMERWGACPHPPPPSLPPPTPSVLPLKLIIPPVSPLTSILGFGARVCWDPCTDICCDCVCGFF